jgi:DNA-binding beta-propeller fold protein YncE
VANAGGATVSQYSIGASGGLTPMGTPTVAAGSLPQSVSVDPSGKYAYVANYGGDVSQYTIGASGGLTPMGTPTVAAGTGPISVTTTGTWQ